MPGKNTPNLNTSPSTLRSGGIKSAWTVSTSTDYEATWQTGKPNQIYEKPNINFLMKRFSK